MKEGAGLCFCGEKMVQTSFAEAGDNKSWRKEKTGLEMRQGVEVRKI